MYTRKVDRKILLILISCQTVTCILNFGNIINNLETFNQKTKISSKCLQKRTNILLKDSKETKSNRDKDLRLFAQDYQHSEVPAIVNLLNYLSIVYINYCGSVVLYDEFYGNKTDFLKMFLTTYPLSVMQGRSDSYNSLTGKSDKMCKQFILFLSDPMQANSIVGDQSFNTVVIVTQVSRLKVQEFLMSPASQRLVTLLVIRVRNIMDKDEDGHDITLYTHDLFVDGLGSSSLRVLTTWRCGELTRPGINLFPRKMIRGFSGHQFTVAAGNQPPGHYYDGNKRISLWDGLELRVLWLLGEMLNFHMDIQEPDDALFLPEAPNAIVKQVKAGLADIGVGGIYITPDRYNLLTFSSPHTQDCATFMTMTSTALPRYRAIMGPFHWTVWLTLTLTYLLAIFPISFSDSHSLMHLFKNPWQIENMFWYVRKSWTGSTKAATRMLIGWYWVFSIIISACYTGCIIAFVTLPVYPPHYDSCYEVVQERLQVGTLSSGGWQYWFNDSVDPMATQMFEKIEYLPDLESAMENITTSYYRNYAFLGSYNLLEYLMKINYTKRNEGKSYLYLGKDCFVSFGVSVVFPPEAPHSRVMGQMILRIIQSGLITKLKRDLEWDLQRTSSGKLLAAVGGSIYKSSKAMERKLTLEDVQGMFLLLGAGFGIAAFVLTIEFTAWLLKYIKDKCCNVTKPGDSAKNSQQRIFINEISLKRRIVSDFQKDKISSVPEDKPCSRSSPYVNRFPVSAEVTQSQVWALPDNRNYLREQDCFGDLVNHESAEYDTRSMQYFSDKESVNTSRAFTL
ncbi:hypothetical protein L9F63_019538 [Diploptera punctata]|uniref:Ionotropic glutamate receptor C-terminal domain-containing protein n=1 Tax=Diploptera punctata TaxID=6984 RepID=A0AAD8EE90_DIPPU|nr:hypothetical protein L9F63_019538 [Diploptera punctata]